MALILPGPIVADIRGGVGDVVFSRGPGGACVRARTFPHELTSPAREAVWDAMKIIGPAWNAYLTPQQRDDWRAYAKQWPRPNRLGGGSHGSGYVYFTRINSHLTRLTHSVIFLQAPTSGPLSPPIITAISPGYDELTIQLPPINYTPPAQDMLLWLFLGQPVAAGRNYYGGPWRYTDHNMYYQGEWQSDPWIVEPPWGISTGQRIFGYVIAQAREGGEISTRHQFRTDAT